MQSAVQDLITRVTALEKYVNETEHLWASAVERIEQLEPSVRGGDEAEIALRRQHLARLGPFKASTNDKDSILANDGRVLLVVYSGAERDIVLQALNDAWLAES
jgi:hypothetical protein